MKVTRIFLLVCILAVATANQNFDCDSFNKVMKNDELALDAVQEALKSGNIEFDITCIQDLMRNNLFTTTDYLMENYFYAMPDKFKNEDMLE